MQSDRIPRGLREAGGLLLDLIFPRRCPVCHEAAMPPYHICPACRARLPFIGTARCGKCGKPVPGTDRLCDDCRTRQHAFDRGLGLLLYDETMRSTMSYLKYRGRKEYGEALGELLAEYTADLAALWRPSVIVPVPLHPKKMNTRTYNQAAEIARPLARAFGIPMAETMLRRSSETLAMKNLDAVERFRNLEGAFEPGPGFVPARSVLLVDDIYTTGATMDAASLTLREAGIREIYFLTVCIGGGFMVQY